MQPVRRLGLGKFSKERLLDERIAGDHAGIASRTSGTTITAGDSCACFAASLRGAPRKVTMSMRVV